MGARVLTPVVAFPSEVVVTNQVPVDLATRGGSIGDYHAHAVWDCSDEGLCSGHWSAETAGESPSCVASLAVGPAALRRFPLTPSFPEAARVHVVNENSRSGLHCRLSAKARTRSFGPVTTSLAYDMTCAHVWGVWPPSQSSSQAKRIVIEELWPRPNTLAQRVKCGLGLSFVIHSPPSCRLME